MTPVRRQPGTGLTALRAQLAAAVAATGQGEADLPDNEQLAQAGQHLLATCWAVVDAPGPRTRARWALQAAAVMHQLRFGYGGGRWANPGEALAWRLLSDLAGAAYAPPRLPGWLQASEEPPRVAATSTQPSGR